MPDNAIPFLATIQAEAAAGDPRVQGSVLIFADWLEERGDPRAGWLRGIMIVHHIDGSNDGWEVWPGHDPLHRYSSFLLEPDALRELARRVLEAMTLHCPHFELPVRQRVDGKNCPACHGHGWLLAEAEACNRYPCCEAVKRVEASPRRLTDNRLLIGGECPIHGETCCCISKVSRCGGKGWRIKLSADPSSPSAPPATT